MYTHVRSRTHVYTKLYFIQCRYSIVKYRTIIMIKKMVIRKAQKNKCTAIKKLEYIYENAQLIAY
jgi:hypothetical protein